MTVRKALAPSHLLLGAVSYVDTVRIWLPRFLRREELSRLFKASPHSIYRPHPLKWQPYFKCCLILQYPFLQFLEREDWAQEAKCVTRLDIALDLLTENQESACKVQQFLNVHQIKRWRGKQRQGQYGDTTYSSASPNVTTQLTRYADKPSKVSESPCCHVEWRINTREGVRSAGVNTLRDIHVINHSAFWRRRLQLAQVNMDALGNTLVSHSYWSPGRVAAHAWRASGNVQALVDIFKQSARSSLLPIGTAWMLPND